MKFERPFLNMSQGNSVRDAWFAIDHVYRSLYERHRLRENALSQGLLANPMSSATYDDYGEYINVLAQEIAQGLNDTFAYPIRHPQLVTLYSQDEVGHPNTQGNQGELVLTHGVTQAFSLFCAYITMQAQLAGVRPAMLFPTPTYGLFSETLVRPGLASPAAQRDENGRYIYTPEVEQHLQRGVFPIFIQRLPDGRVNSADVREALAWVSRHQGDYSPPLVVVGYYDSNPNNPTGHVRGDSETQQLAEVFSEHNATAPTFYLGGDEIWTAHLVPIDDIVYYGTQYDKQGYEDFGLFCKHMTTPTVLMYGPSKTGAAQHRVGAMLAPSAIAKVIRKYQFDSHYLCGLEQFLLLEAFVSTRRPELGAQREWHLRRTSEEHRLSGAFLKALINGNASSQEVARWSDIYQRSMPSVGIEDVNHMHELLTRGIPGIRDLSDPASGFFHVIDVTNWKNHHPQCLKDPIRDSNDVWRWCDSEFNMVFGTGNYFDFGLFRNHPRFGMEHDHFPTNEERLLIRLTTSFPLSVMLEVARRLNAANRQAQTQQGRLSLAEG